MESQYLSNQFLLNFKKIPIKDPVTFELKNEKDEKEIITVDKTVLSVLSKKFELMFNGNMKESTMPIVEIKETNSKNFRLFLKILYGTRLDSYSVERDINLLKLADEYLCDNLRAHSIEILASIINQENVVEITKLGDLLNIQEIKEGASDFLANSEEVSDEILKEMPNSVLQMMTSKVLKKSKELKLKHKDKKRKLESKVTKLEAELKKKIPRK